MSDNRGVAIKGVKNDTWIFDVKLRNDQVVTGIREEQLFTDAFSGGKLFSGGIHEVHGEWLDFGSNKGEPPQEV